MTIFSRKISASIAKTRALVTRNVQSPSGQTVTKFRMQLLLQFSAVLTRKRDQGHFHCINHQPRLYAHLNKRRIIRRQLLKRKIKNLSLSHGVSRSSSHKIPRALGTVQCTCFIKPLTVVQKLVLEISFIMWTQVKLLSLRVDSRLCWTYLRSSMLYTEPRRLSRMRSNGNKVATKRGNIVFTGQRCRYISVLFIVFFFGGGVGG